LDKGVARQGGIPVCGDVNTRTDGRLMPGRADVICYYKNRPKKKVKKIALR
jgi:hypothetical protein